MKRAMTLTALLVLGASSQIWAQAPLGQGAGVEAIVASQEGDPEPAPTAKQMLQAWFDDQEDLFTGYDEEKAQIVTIESLDFDVKDPRVSADFIYLRSEKMSELLLKAKASVIETIMSQMSATRILDVPGNPIAKQLEKEQAELAREIRLASEELAALNAEAQVALKERDRMSASEVFAVIASWFTRADRENLAEKYTEERKAKYLAARQQFEAAKKRYDDLQEKAEAIRGQVTKEMKSSISRVAQMPIYGCTILQQAESYTPKANGGFTCQLAVVYIWSMEMQTAAAEILKGESVTFAPGKRSIKAYLAKKAANGALASWCGPRQYIDNEGNMWFLGIACTPIADDADENDEACESAALSAATEVVFSLYSDAASAKTLDQLMQTRIGADGDKETILLRDYHKTQQESFSAIQISGNSPLFADKLRHQPSGLEMNVAVYGINSGKIKSLRAIQKATVALGIAVNTAQETERGRQAELQRAFETSKHNAAARAQGAEEIRQSLADDAAAAKARREQRKQQATPVVTPPAKTPAGKPAGNLRPSASFIIDDED